MLQPKRQKYRKQHKGRNRGLAHKGSTISFGSFGLKSMDFSRLTSRQLEAARVALTRNMKREGKVWIRVFPDKPITSKPAEVRMGKGKGAVDHYVCEVQPGRIIFEVEGVPADVAIRSLELAAQKLPIICKAVTRYDYEG
jgi:large subunit ribosomal protein L16